MWLLRVTEITLVAKTVLKNEAAAGSLPPRYKYHTDTLPGAEQAE